MTRGTPMHIVAAPLRSALVALLALAIALTVLVALPPAPSRAQDSAPFINLERLPAADFVQAGREVSRVLFPGKAAGAVLATTATFPDALSSSALAAKVGGPILFTATGSLPAATREELTRVLDPGATVTLMGGPVAISDAVAQQVRELGFGVERIQGDTRIETAAAAARVVGLPADGTVVIARAFGSAGRDRVDGWVDSVSCGGFAARSGTPVLLTETAQLSSATDAALRQLGARRAIICGGEVAVSGAVDTALRERGVAVERVQGDTRVQTAITAATRLFGASSPAGREIILVNGYDEHFGYGLAATQLSARRNAPILLTNTTEPTDCGDAAQPSRGTLCYLRRAGTDAARVTVVGGTAVVSQAVAEAAAAAAGGERAEPLAAPTAVKAAPVEDDGSRLTVTWDAVADPQGILAGYNVYVGEAAASTRQGDSPTVGEGTRTFTVENLQPDTEHRVEVAAVDDLGREGARSKQVVATTGPLSAVRELRAVPGNGRVTLTWEPNPEPSVSEYQIERKTASSCDSMVTSWGERTSVPGRTTTTHEDTTAENDTAYCYRIRAFDGSDADDEKASEWAVAGPVTPSTNPLSVTVSSPEGGSTLRAGTTHTIRYTINGALGSLADHELILAYSTDGGSTYSQIARRTHGVEGAEGTHEWAVPDVNSQDSQLSGPGGRVRITVFEPDEEGMSGEGRSDAFTLDRRPAAVSGAAAVVDGEAIRLTWDPNTETTVTGYAIERTEVTNLTSSTNTEQACDSPFGETDATYATVSGRTSTEFTDTAVARNSGSTSQNRYCYRVRAQRTGDGGDGASSSRTSATLPAVSAPDVALQKPEDGELIRTNRGYTIRYTVSTPPSEPADRVVLDYCVTYDTGPRLPASDNEEARCTSGWKGIGQGPATDGDHSHSWSVPSDIPQTDSGAIRARIYAAASQAADDPSASSVRSGIRFR